MVRLVVRPALLQVTRWAEEPLVKRLVPRWVPAREALWGDSSANSGHTALARAGMTVKRRWGRLLPFAFDMLHGEGGDDPVGGSAVQPRAEAACQLRNFRRDWLAAQFRRQARVGQPLLQRIGEKQF
ncbi:hypothetical protein [Accumulibacter sp.]|uniref:hypothetical protein n=1 Tax=Accumulibacter sp. TaxID=2053492 RepID=UPI001D1B3E79|nr:hypothetical protein [Accumulibacter sp.]MCB1932525.1 hypothetical protein [Accumulibacter sp.]MCB1965597.1 hypothetical protein [Accumulibacter sp.]MCP5229962.1 hypothetical protein [Accumulibacter sp.]